MSGRIIKRIKQLCSLDLDSPLLLFALLPELRKLIPSDAASFIWLDGRGEFTNTYHEAPGLVPYAAHCLDDFLAQCLWEVPAHGGLRACAGARVNGAHASRLAEAISAIFYYPSACHKSLVSVVAAQGRPLGLLLIHRSHADGEFSFKEKRALQQLEPYIAHVAEKRGQGETRMGTSGEVGLLFCSGCGDVQYLSAQGWKLLFLATHAVVTGAAPVLGHDAVVAPPELVRLCKDISARSPGGEAGHESPEWRLQNGWGRFVFRGHCLQSAQAEACGRVAITVQRLEPLPLTVFRRCEHFAMTAKQMEVCQMLVMGHSYDSIARRMGVSPYTVIDHVKKIYKKLAVANRSELITKLVA